MTAPGVISFPLILGIRLGAPMVELSARRPALMPPCARSRRERQPLCCMGFARRSIVKVCPPDLVDPMRRRKILALGCGKAERAVFCARVAENASFVTVSFDGAAEPTFLLGAFGSQDIWESLADRR